MAITLEKAWELAADGSLERSRAKELRDGWFFPCQSGSVGSHGVIVNKHTGRILTLGSAFPLERDLRMYELGYQFELNDLVVLRIGDLARALDMLEALGLTIVEPAYESGTVWRIPRPLTRDELETRLSTLPCVFGPIGLYFGWEHLEAARIGMYFGFELLEYIGPPVA